MTFRELLEGNKFAPISKYVYSSDVNTRSKLIGIVVDNKNKDKVQKIIDGDSVLKSNLKSVEKENNEQMLFIFKL